MSQRCWNEGPLDRRESLLRGPRVLVITVCGSPAGFRPLYLEPAFKSMHV